ncbi:elongation factor P 5-aminopentanone reductase [Alteribacter aurantiacus]|uniref:elongation factor P 5-aminopentanone reductase n=1 Tax=Alteribacter aurantiacus TaxID=254410 RepID=UPI000403E44D|nr:SDR family oxidoreductase [Alteribacter aurantiacus]
MPVAFVTGASGTIGQSIAVSLAQKGYSLILHYNNNKEAVLETSNRILTASGEEPNIVQGDLSDPTSVSELCDKIKVVPDVLVHNSGKSYTGLVQDFQQTDLEGALQLGLIAPYQITNHFLPDMIKRKSGKIIVISSVWGLTGASCEVLYSMVKGGLNAYVKALAKELGPSGIQVNAVAPGFIQSNMNNVFSNEEIEEVVSDIPAGRPGTPEEVAEAVCYLASPFASYVSGQILSVNGAWYC